MKSARCFRPACFPMGRMTSLSRPPTRKHNGNAAGELVAVKLAATWPVSLNRSLVVTWQHSGWHMSVNNNNKTTSFTTMDTAFNVGCPNVKNVFVFLLRYN